ncbi:carboxyl transferase domain-containing protein [Nakamurella lactea]|uniref:carboxyl transferase domain-containing protein n=1 Tax=Nakamurella lactea TaxID=459515 RepID=UPI0003FEB102|nr:carboxyl transferase domain-containing protein [Nakamurella lactea]
MELTRPTTLVSPLGGSVVAVGVTPGDQVGAGDLLVVIEAMKMEYHLDAEHAGMVRGVHVGVGDVVTEGQPLVDVDGLPDTAGGAGQTEEIGPGGIRADLAAVLVRRAMLRDEARGAAVRKRHRSGMRTARENVADLTDGGLLVEFGGLAVAAQRRRRDIADLQAETPADGMVTGIGRVNGAVFPDDRTACAVLAYDYTVLAGTQGYFNHRKTDRLLERAYTDRLPVVLFAEGGGGRPSDVDIPMVAGLNVPTFSSMGALAGRVPTVGIAAGRCFAGNAALLGCCHVVIATTNSTIGLGGPAMISGGGLGVYAAEEVGPIDVQTRNGVVDIAVADEAGAVSAAKRYLGYFQGGLPTWEHADQRRLRELVPQDRKRAYDVRAVIDTMFDTDSVLELRAAFGAEMVTALARIEGHPVAVLANNPAAGGGAISADGADKAARFLRLCDTFAFPVVSLCDTPGFLVGPESEKTAAVRHVARLFTLGAHLTVPLLTVVLRKAYGLGAMAMGAGNFGTTAMTVSWPTGEFGGMGVEGAVRLGFRDELAAIDDESARRRRFDELVAQSYQRGGAMNAASHLEVDDVIDPERTRATIAGALLSAGGPAKDGWVNPHARNYVDTW